MTDDHAIEQTAAALLTAAVQRNGDLAEELLLGFVDEATDVNALSVDLVGILREVLGVSGHAIRQFATDDQLEEFAGFPARLALARHQQEETS